MKEFRIGVVGYSPPSLFDTGEALRMVKEAYDALDRSYPGALKIVVAGLTDTGVSSIAYREAVKRGWKTSGVACRKAYDHPLFPVDARMIVGENWGDESPTFLSGIDAIIRIGGGSQSTMEAAESRKAGKPVIEYDLPKLGEVSR